MSIRIAVAQTSGTPLAQWRSTSEQVLRRIADAAECGADLIVLPECIWPAYLFDSPEDYRDQRRAGLPAADSFLAELSDAARAYELAICAGYVRETDAGLANAACFIDREGTLLHEHHKCFLWDTDQRCFAPGAAIDAFDTCFGRIGIMICADARLPEIPATLVARGARLLLQPTCWVNVGTPDALWNPQPEHLIPSRAREFGVPIASANKCGRELNTTFVGQSLICDAEGDLVIAAGRTEPELLVAEVELPEQCDVGVARSSEDRLLSSDPPGVTRADVPPLLVRLDAGAADPRVEPDRATLLVSQPSAHREAHAAPGGSAARLSGPGAVVEVAGIRIASADDQALERFAPLRVLALDGTHLVVIFGDNVDSQHLHTRAAENRIFVLALGAAGGRLIDPRGRLIARRTWANSDPTFEIDVAQAANKEVMPDTDAIAGRTPNLYAFRSFRG